MMSRSTVNFNYYLLAIALCISSCLGCSLEEDTLQQALDKAQRATAGQNTFLTAAISEGQAADTTLAATTDVLAGQELVEGQVTVASPPVAPYPDRFNPFEFGEGIDFDAPHTRQNEKLEIKLFGFIGAEHPKAIVSVDGRTKALASGEKWGALEILEVTPPTVRIKSNNVVRMWSLLGHANQSHP